MITPYTLCVPQAENLIECEQKNGLETVGRLQFGIKSTLSWFQRALVGIPVKFKGDIEVVSGMLR